MFRDSGTPQTFSRPTISILIITTVRRFANDVVAPKVREMDENEMMDPAVIKGLFEQGVRSVFSICHELNRRKLAANGYRNTVRIRWR